MELKIKNFGHGNGVEVRIIKVSADAVFENLNNQFQQMDLAGVEHGIILGIPTQISCDDARSFASLITLDTNSPSSFTIEYNDQPPETFDDLEQLTIGLENNNLRLVELEIWNPVVEQN